MAENYDLIFGQSASQQYAWSDSDYQNGWQTVGNTPPTAEQFDALQRKSDTKAKDLNNRLSPLETKAEADGRQAATSYASGAMLTVDGLPNGWLLECITPGISGTDAITLPSNLIDGLTIIDGNVTWALRKVATNGGIGYRQPSTAYAAGNIAYHASLPTGCYLECTTGGTTSSGDLAVISPNIGRTVSDGTAQWQIRKGVTLPYELPEYMETLLGDKGAETARATLGAPSTTGANASGNWNINAATATKLATPRKIELTGNVTGSADFDGSKDIQIATSLADAYLPLSGGEVAGAVNFAGGATGNWTGTVGGGNVAFEDKTRKYFDSRKDQSFDFVFNCNIQNYPVYLVSVGTMFYRNDGSSQRLINFGVAALYPGSWDIKWLYSKESHNLIDYVGSTYAITMKAKAPLTINVSWKAQSQDSNTAFASTSVWIKSIGE